MQRSKDSMDTQLPKWWKKKTSLKIDFSLYDWNQKACSSPSLSVAANNFTEKGWFLDNLACLLPYTFTFSVVWNSAQQTRKAQDRIYRFCSHIRSND